MGIKILAKTELGNVMEITGDEQGLVMKRVEDVSGQKVEDHIIRGNRLTFNGETFQLFEGDVPVADTFGKAIVKELQIS
ncbi:MAG: hypothetical protein ABH805_00865 [Candidatus Nealsonbacteria bacterium]